MPHKQINAFVLVVAGFVLIAAQPGHAQIPCTADAQCDDLDVCTTNICCPTTGTCVFAQIPDKAGCGDCDNNSVPDYRQIAECTPGDLTCTDCDANLILDICEGGAAPECQTFGNVGGGGPWSAVVGNADSLAVTLDAVDVILDVNVQVRALRLINGATLTVSANDPAGVGFDLAVTAGGIFLQSFDPANESAILTTQSRRIRSCGVILMAEGSAYRSANPTDVTEATSLSAASIVLTGIRCGATSQMNLSGNMSASVFEKVVLDGTGTTACPAADPQSSLARGGKTPPIFKVSAEPLSFVGAVTAGGPVVPVLNDLDVGGSFTMIDRATVCVGCDTPGQSKRPNIVVSGDFDNRNLDPVPFDWNSGQLTMAGNGNFEVGGLDVGAALEGFQVRRSRELNRNFSFGDLNIGPAATVTFTDRVRNATPNDGTWAANSCSEAVYVETLRIDPTANLAFDNCRVYYITLDDPNQRLNVAQRIGCGDAIQLLPVPAVSQWGLIILALLIVIAATVVTRRRLSHG